VCKWLCCILEPIFRYMPRNGIAGLYDISIFSFWGTSILLSIEVGLIYIPISSAEVFLSPHILTSICCLCYWWWPFWLGWGGISMSLNLYFLYDQGCWALFHVLLDHLYFFFWELSIQFICPFIHWAVDSLCS
jgi:hypothetical protein